MRTPTHVARRDSSAPPRWMNVAEAAAILAVGTVSLRRAIERNARRVDGSIESRLDGLVARKFGRLWRVSLDPAWTDPHREPPKHPRATPGDCGSARRGEE